MIKKSRTKNGAALVYILIISNYDDWLMRFIKQQGVNVWRPMFANGITCNIKVNIH
jgi:hypothetical protein